MRSSNDRIQKAAAKALAIFSDVTNPHDVVFDVFHNRGFDALSPPQKVYVAVSIYDAEVNNGGHSQYFVNSSGDHWKQVGEGLRAIGAKGCEKVLDDATRLFGSKGPSENNDTRHRQLGGFSSQQDKSFDELDRRYHDSDENIQALLALYAIAHKEHFTAPRPE
ncbi:MAG TPA: DUF4375 domain-containing protein [Planctomycetes bacterium]|nr:DUF4375 domain-containing protein [Planctomycetota bacterium]